jgi:hypothetical protein
MDTASSTTGDSSAGSGTSSSIVALSPEAIVVTAAPAADAEKAKILKELSAMK